MFLALCALRNNHRVHLMPTRRLALLPRVPQVLRRVPLRLRPRPLRGLRLRPGRRACARNRLADSRVFAPAHAAPLGDARALDIAADDPAGFYDPGDEWEWVEA